MVILFIGAGYINISAQANSTVKLTIEPQSTLTIDGTSTLHSFTIKAKEIEGYLTLDKANTDASNSDVSGKISDLSVVVPVKKLDSDKSSMNDNMDDALKADDNPNITYKLLSVDQSALPKVVGDSVNLNTTGELTIAGKKKDIEMTVKTTLLKDGQYEFAGQKKVNMKDYGVKPPTMFFGTIKVGADVVVKFDIVASVK